MQQGESRKRADFKLAMEQWMDTHSGQEGPGCVCGSRSRCSVVVAVVHLPPTAPRTPRIASGRIHRRSLSLGHGGDWEEIRGYIHCVGRKHVSKIGIQNPIRKQNFMVIIHVFNYI